MAKENFENKLEGAKKILETLINPEITLQDSVKAYEYVDHLFPVQSGKYPIVISKIATAESKE